MNSKWHLYISFIKSFIRIAGCLIALYNNSWTYIALGIAVAEIFGLAEELKDDR